MDINDTNTIISQRTGIPIELLTGTTIEENLSRAKEILSLRSRLEANRPKSTREQFSEWMNRDSENMSNPGAVFDDLRREFHYMDGGYPVIKDGSFTVENAPDFRNPREQFSDWMSDKLSFNPYRNEDGWIRLN